MSDIQRETILRLAREFYDSRPVAPFEPGVTYIPPSGKVLDAEDCAHLIDASLDMWLTAGRYADQFEEQVAALRQAYRVRICSQPARFRLPDLVEAG
jgi:CDP-4-dehydro-6-deoxyglucose reductase, E1